MNSDDMALADQLLGAARIRGVAADVYLAREEITTVSWGTEGTRSGSIRRWARVTVRAIVDGRLGWSTSRLPFSPWRVLSMACINARFGPRVAWSFADDGEHLTEHSPSRRQWDDPSMLLEQVVDLAVGLRQRWKGVHAVATLSVTESRRLLATSGGAAWAYECPRVGVALLARPTQVAQGIPLVSVEHTGVTLAPVRAATAESIGMRLALLKSPAQQLGRSVPIVLASDAAALVLNLALTTLCVPRKDPDWIARRRPSWHRSFTIWDDGTGVDFQGGAPCDDEGIPSQRTLLVDGGAVRGCIVDRMLSSEYCIPPTGNGIRGEAGLPEPRLRNIVIEPYQGGGPAAIAELPEALIIYDMSLIETADATQLAARIDLAALVRWGEPTHRISGGVLQGSLVEALGTAMPVDDRATVANPTAIPSLLFETGLEVRI